MAAQLTRGMFSYQRIARSHLGQRERGETTDSSAGHRAMHTFRKEPTQAPAKKMKNAIGSGGGVRFTSRVGVRRGECRQPRRRSAIRRLVQSAARRAA